MFCIDEYNRTRISIVASSPSCTSLPAKWLVPSRPPKGAQSVHEMEIYKPTYDTVPPSSKKDEPLIPTSTAKVTAQRVLKLKQELRQSYSFTTCGMRVLIKHKRNN